MEPSKAKQYLEGLKKQVRQRELFEALDVAIEALAWKSLEDKVKIIDVEEDTGLSLGDK